jgi:hypothetical protein
MRLSEWRAAAPNRDALATKVLATVEPALAAMGAVPDPQCWVVWGDDPGIRYTLLVPIDAGLVTCFVRVNIPGEGPRASAKLVRWSRVQVGELALETQAGHRVISFQVEGQVLRGADADADRIGEFAMWLFAAIDGRPIPVPKTVRRPRTTKPASSSGSRSVRSASSPAKGAARGASTRTSSRP